MDIDKYLGDLVGSKTNVERTQGTIEQNIRDKYAARRAADTQPESVKIEEKVVAERSGGPTPPVPPPDEVAEPDPAVEAELVGSKAKEVAFKAIGTSQGLIIGIGGAAGDPNKLDLDGEFLEKGDLIKMAFDFTSASTRTFKANHKDVIDCKLVESWVGTPIIQDGDGLRALKANEKLTDEMRVAGISLDDQTHWFVGAQITDPELKAKASEVVGFSWGAGVVKTEV